MLNLMKLARRGKRSLPHEHFAKIIGDVRDQLLSLCVAHHSGLGPDASALADADVFATSYLYDNLIRKHAGLYGLDKSSPEDLEIATLRGFLKQEASNAAFNKTATFGYNPFTGEYESDLLGDKLLLEVRDLISLIIGDKPNIDKIVSSSFFGNGASATLSRSHAQDTEKYRVGLSSTRNLLNFATKVVGSSRVWVDAIDNGDPVIYVDRLGTPRFGGEGIRVCNASVYDSVPKDASINRVILKEPELNGYFQHGIGSQLRSLLRRGRNDLGIPGANLNTSGSENSDLAKEGSFTGRWASVDASRASDSITLALCEFLLPPLWMDLIYMVRTPYVRLPCGREMRLNMVSGMGNGFTFELESLIFYAIGYVCAKRSTIPFAEQAVNVHGDDLIVPSDVMELVELCYTSAGLTINRDKSFATGPFRESCGGHFFNGNSVKPFFVKKQNGLSRGDWFWLYNSLLLWLGERSPSFHSSSWGKSLYVLLKHIGWYASSGNPCHYAVPDVYSRRSGIFSMPPKLHRRTHWKTKLVTIRPTKCKNSDIGRYARWLDLNRKVPTVLEMCQFSDTTDNPWEIVTEAVEIERWVKLTAWPVTLDLSMVRPFGAVDES